MEIVVIIQSSLVALLGYYLYIAHRDLRDIKGQINWFANEIYAIKSQVKGILISDVSVSSEPVKIRKTSVRKISTNKPRKEKP